MAMVFMDGFESWGANAADVHLLLPRKWANSGSNNPQNQPFAGRNGGQALVVNTTLTGPSFPSQSTWITGFGFYTGAYNQILFRYYDTSTIQFSVKNNVNGYFEVWNGNFSTLLATGTTPVHLTTWYYVEVKVTIHNTAGAVTLKINGNTDISISSVNTRVSANNTANKIEFAGGIGIDDFYLCDSTGSTNNDFLGDHKIETLMPNAAGNYAQWTPTSGANYTTVNETYANDDTNYVSTATANNIDSYNFANLSLITGDIKAINVNMFLRKDAAGSKSVAPFARIASTDYVGTTIPVVDSYIDSNQIYETNPNTAVAWTVSDVNAAEFGIKLIS